MSEEEVPSTQQWIEDGHKIHFRLEPGEVTISHVECPNRGVTALCNRQREHCVVDTFVSLLKAECCIGSTTINGPEEVAWTPVLGYSDLDHEFSQVWIVPMSDPDYIAMKVLQGKTKGDSV